MSTAASRDRLGGQAGFTRFWVASTVSDFGTSVTAVALQVLIVVTLHGSATDVGLVSAARWLPYPVLGLLVGVLADRVRRLPVLVCTDLGRALVLGGIPALFYTHVLTIGVLAAVVAMFGLLSLANDAAHQSFLPQLVPRHLLAAANARIEQSNSAAQTTGPALAGAIVSWLSAPVAILVDSVSFLASGLLTAAIRTSGRGERPAGAGRIRDLLPELRGGLAWVYRHPTLTPLALTTHVWTLFFAVLSTVYAPFALRGLGLSPFALGVTLALAGLGGVVGAGLSTRVAARAGIAYTIAGAWAVEAVAFAIVASTPSALGGFWWSAAWLGVGQLLVGFGFGVGGPLELAYRQSVTPDELQGRMNATMRSFNRTAVVVGAPLGGLLADAAGYRPALWCGAAGVAVMALLLIGSRFRHATAYDEPPRSEPDRQPDR